MFLPPEEWQAVRLSALVATVAVLGSLLPGIALAWLLARRQFWGKLLVETAVNLPLVLPPVVTGYLLLVLFGRQGWIGQYLDRWFGVQLIFTWKAAAIASAIMAFPLLVRAIRLAISAVDIELEQAARSLGAGPWDTFWSVTLPLSRGGVLAGCVLAFARSIGEFGATIMISGNIPGETRTIPLAIYNQLESPGGDGSVRRLIVFSVLLAAIAMLVGELLTRRSQARLRADS